MKRLDITQPQKVQYCIPMWLRDEQIKLAIARRGIGRLNPSYDRREEPVAVACYGPSLRDTWEEIRRFPVVISCSGAHRFLIDRGIVPNWHVAVDPLPKNTVQLIGEPHPDVEYLIASTCHQDVFDHLRNNKVTLWHVFDSDNEGIRVLPPGEWALTGGCDVGLRSLVIAAFLGFREIHVFGMDGNARETRHADEHPSSGKKSQWSEVDYDGVTYYTTVGMLEAARSVWHELDQLPSIKVTFYGEGLVQHMWRNYKPQHIKENKPYANIIAFQKSELISTEYRELNAQLHKENLSYGVGGEKHTKTVLRLAETLATKDILDYGCGKGRLAKTIPWHIQEYDPAIPGKEESPKPADLVVATDVLEHIEPDKLHAVLEDLKRCILKIGYFTIHTGPAKKHLADGRNTHLIQQNAIWWYKVLSKFFSVGKILVLGPELHIVVAPLGQPKPNKAPISVVAS